MDLTIGQDQDKTNSKQGEHRHRDRHGTDRGRREGQESREDRREGREGREDDARQNLRLKTKDERRKIKTKY